MSRHNRKVPTSFFYRFTRDVCAFADKWAQGRIVSVLEGGYSDKALLSGAMAHLVGLVDGGSAGGGKETYQSRETWWSPENVQMVRILRSRRRGGNLEADLTAKKIVGKVGPQETSRPTLFA
jgi:histone deacetylase HOS3